MKKTWKLKQVQGSVLSQSARVLYSRASSIESTINQIFSGLIGLHSSSPAGVSMQPTAVCVEPADDGSSVASHVNTRVEFVVGRMMITVLPAMFNSEPIASEVKLSVMIQKQWKPTIVHKFQLEIQQLSYRIGLRVQASAELDSGYKKTELLFVNSLNVSENVAAPSAFTIQTHCRV